MSETPTHYRFYVKAPFIYSGIQFTPGVRYTVKASVYDAIVAAHAEAVDEAQPLFN